MRKNELPVQETDDERQKRYAKAELVRDEIERKELEELAKYERMKEIANELWIEGRHYLVSPGLRRLEFKTWQEALDFQAYCKEKNFSVRIVDPRPRPGVLDNYHKVYAE